MDKLKTKGERNISLTERDDDILLFLWRWKVVSTAGIAARFFPNGSKMSTYRRLNKLRHHKYIKLEDVKWSCKYAWKLSKKGYVYIWKQLPTQTDKSRGYNGEFPRHDFLASAFHIGGWITEMPDCAGVVSEQSIRRQEPQTLPWWVPKTDFHNPDGYWYFNNGEQECIVALEVELSVKPTEKYKSFRSFYNSMENINYCIWVVKNRAFAKRIFNILDESGSSLSCKHQFLLTKDVDKFNWGSEIILGSKKGMIFSDFLRSLGQNIPRTSDAHVQGLCMVEAGLSRGKTSTYKHHKKRKKIN